MVVEKTPQISSNKSPAHVKTVLGQAVTREIKKTSDCALHASTSLKLFKHEILVKGGATALGRRVTSRALLLMFVFVVDSSLIGVASIERPTARRSSVLDIENKLLLLMSHDRSSDKTS